MAKGLNTNYLYRPVQPALLHASPYVLYHEVQPAEPVHKIIYCYWQLKSMQPLSQPFSCRVVADGCIDIFFSAQDPRDSQVMGFSNRFASFDVGEDFHFIGIRFLPAQFPLLFNISAAELAHRTESLDLVLKPTFQFLMQSLPPAASFAQVCALLDAYFSRLVAASAHQLCPRFRQALHQLLCHKGNLAIEQDLDTGLSPRHLRRYFSHFIGDSAKAFSQVVRFQSFLAEGLTTGGHAGQGRYFDAGYYDQAHFIKQFRQLYGLTPGQALKA